MVISGEEYFDLCHQRFLKSSAESDSGCDRFINIGGRLSVHLKFAAKHLVAPLMRALAHLAASPVQSPDLTVCIWDNPPELKSVLLFPFSGDTEKSKRQTCGGIQISCDLWPPRLSLYSAERNLAMFWVEDIHQLPWYECGRPLRNIIHWKGLKQKMYMVHAACIGTPDGGVLVTGRPGAGKSTTALSSLNGELSFASDDLCLIGFEGTQVFGYSIYNTAKLENFEKLPHLEKHIYNRHRPADEKAILYVHDCLPGKMLLKTPILAILTPKVTGERVSKFVPIPHQEAFNVLTGSTGTELGGTSAEDFFGPYKICKSVPCYRLEAGTDLDELNKLIASFIEQ